MHNRHRQNKIKQQASYNVEKEAHFANRDEKNNVLSLKLICLK